ncbi:phage terminase small subunit P27 family [Lacrimispora saccharolytica]|nr:phage terminase small subunit P27 family [Lacrimispora saccharolytica]
MAGQRQPIELVLAKGNKHLTQKEIEERKSSEVKPITDDISPPPYLNTKKQKEEFNKIANQLMKLKILGETDVDTLARYILSRDLYVNLTKQIRKKKILEDPILLDKYMKNQDRAFRQCDVCAKALGLTISSRCRLVVPETKQEVPKENKFKKFEKRAVSGD